MSSSRTSSSGCGIAGFSPATAGTSTCGSAADLSQALFEHDIPGLFFRHVRGLRIRGFRLSWDDVVPDFLTYGIEGEDFRDVEIQGFEGRQARTGSGACIALRNGAGITIRDCCASPGTATFLEQTGVTDQRLLVNNDIRSAQLAFTPARHGFTASGNMLGRSASPRR